MSTILIVDADPGVRTLVRLVAQDALPDAGFVEVEDAPEFAVALAEPELTAAIVSREVGWADGHALLAVITRRHPHCAKILLGDPQVDLLEPDAQADLQISHAARGIGRLGEALRRAISRRVSLRAQADGGVAAQGSEPRADELPVAWMRTDIDGVITHCNPHVGPVLKLRDASSIVGQSIEQYLHLGQGLAQTSATRNGAGARLRSGNGRESLWILVASRVADGLLVGFDVCALPSPAGSELDGAENPNRTSHGTGAKPGSESLADLLAGIAHDLRAPTQAAAQSAALLAERLRRTAALRGEDERALSRIVQSSIQAQELIDQIVTYMRADDIAITREWVNLNEVVDEALSLFALEIRASGTVVNCGPLPSIEANRLDFARVFQNLLDNSLKFHDGTAVTIDISANESDTHWLISVSDDGIGVNTVDCERIFEPLSRLQAESDYKGSGMGLAICKKLCERHDGRIWAQPNPQGGLSIFIELPKRAFAS